MAEANANLFFEDPENTDPRPQKRLANNFSRTMNSTPSKINQHIKKQNAVSENQKKQQK